jgi:probable HAF family extracellular repeat protein
MENARGFLRNPYLFGSFSTVVFLSFLGGPRLLEAGPLFNLQGFSIESLGPLASGGALPTGINNSGAAVGWIVDAQGNLNAVSFANGQTSSLGAVGAQANAINVNGAAVGTSYAGGSSPQVTEWANGQTSYLGIAGYGMAINGTGQIAGSHIGADGLGQAFTFSNGVLNDLGTLASGSPGAWSAAYGLNAMGEAAGTSSTGTGAFHAFFSNGSGLADLGTLGGVNSYGLALNDAGTVVGNAQDAHGFSQAVAWDATGIRSLGTLGGMQSYAYGINNSGEIVGYSWTADNFMHGFVYVNGVLLDLNSLLPLSSGWTIEAAYAINDYGEILADGVFNGRHYAVRLNPLDSDPLNTPEPSTLALGAAGLLLLAFRCRSRLAIRRVP